MNELNSVLRSLQKCSSLVDKPWSIEADSDSNNCTFKGVIIGGVDTPIWGSVFNFNLFIDSDNLTAPPRVTFSSDTYHPLIEPIYGTFCFPSNSYNLSSRMPMESFLDELYSLFLLKYPLSSPVNTEAYNTFTTSPSRFWAILRQKSLSSIE